ncbi:hypothetical protein FOCG_17766 [Fusarium oxysporum f. sp. radicis-lycopersici 26381]|nr:hypothetical protein FOWG_17174 [Fusarium oxysporum f. sp. lycopersici MN25]EXL39632.1 hypothetical protein FOCG_17766 [Fusarium oxysporum f. sp. radicis-lycopersici 26381]
MSTCGTCWRQFPAGWQSRQQHMNATGHEAPEFECETCDRYFGSQKAVEQHMTDLDHWDESSESEDIVYECDHCDDKFDDENELKTMKLRTISTVFSAAVHSRTGIVSPSTYAAKLIVPLPSSVLFAKTCKELPPD